MVNIQPWLRRPRGPRGDLSPERIFCAVGLALTLWETIEGEISVAYIGLIDFKGYRVNRYFSTASFERRHALVKKAIDLNVNAKDCGDFGDFMDLALKFGPRRHEIAHGRVFNLGDHGFYLGPNNSLTRNYPNGTAVYQYTSDDIDFYCGQFNVLAEAAKPFAKLLAHH